MGIEKAPRGDVVRLPPPGASQLYAHATLEGRCREIRLRGAKGLDTHSAARRAHRLEVDAVDGKTCADLRCPGAWHDVTAEWRPHHERRRHLVAKRHAPDLRTRRVIHRYRLARDGRDFSRVGIAWKVDQRRAAGTGRTSVPAACGLAPSGAVVEHDLRAGEPRGSRIRLSSQLLPGRAVLRHELRECDDGVAGEAHAS